MMLIGMFDSPFVRRVAVSLKKLEIPFEHANWSVGKDQERIREYNPLGRVPALVLDDGSVIIESAAILDYLDDCAGPDRALLPARGHDRREALRLISHAIGAAEKGRDLIYERVMRPAQKRHQPWVDRCVAQLYGALEILEEQCNRLAPTGQSVHPTLGILRQSQAVSYAFSFSSWTASPSLPQRHSP